MSKKKSDISDDKKVKLLLGSIVQDEEEKVSPRKQIQQMERRGESFVISSNSSQKSRGSGGRGQSGRISAATSSENSSGSSSSNAADRRNSVPTTDGASYNDAKRYLLGDIVPAEDQYVCFDSVKCVLFYSLCCCLCSSNKGAKLNTKASLMRRFTKWIKLNKTETNEDSKMGVVKALMRLYAHQSDAIRELKEMCRVNPDFSSQYRNDLEFYIPQICTFFLRCDIEDPQQLFDFILMAASADFFFAHRVWFFLYSSMLKGMPPEMIVTGQKVIRGLKCLQMSPQGNPSEILFLANSQDVMRLLSDLNLGGQYPHLAELTNTYKRQYLEVKEKQALSPRKSSNSSDSRGSRLKSELIKDSQRDRTTRARKLIQDHSQHQLYQAETERRELLKKQELFQQVNIEEEKANVRASFAASSGSKGSGHSSSITINAKDIVLKPFAFSFDEDQGYAASVAKISDPLRRTKLQGFLSTPCFIQALTDISNKLAFMQAPGDEKRLQLIRDLTKVNEHLPARVYIPFVNDSARNFAVLHIAALESRIFQTKSRAPVLLCIEVYRPDELSEHVEIPPEEPPANNIMTSKDFLDKLMNKKQEEKKSKKPIKARLSTFLQRKRSSSDYKLRPGSDGRSAHADHSDSDQIDRLADLKVSNPLFVGASKLNDHSFIRHVKAESQCHPKTPQVNAAARKAGNAFVFPAEDEPGRQKSVLIKLNKMDGVDGDDETQPRRQVSLGVNQLISVKKLSGRQDCDDDEIGGFLKLHNAKVAAQVNDLPTRVVSQQNMAVRGLLYDNLAAGEGSSSGDHSSQNAIEKLNLLEEDDEAGQSEWQEPPTTLYDRDLISPGQAARTIYEESKFSGSANTLIQQNEEDSDENANDSESSGESDDDEEGTGLTRGKNLRKMSGSQTNRLAAMIKAQSGIPADISQFGYKEMHIDQLFESKAESMAAKSKSKKQSGQGKKLLDSESDEEEATVESSTEQEARIRRHSPFGHLKSWRLLRVIVKANDDVRQEQFAMQLICQIYHIFKLKKVEVWLRPYEILSTGPHCGLIEFVQDSMSLDEIHKKHNTSLRQFFVNKFGRGNPKSKGFKRAQNAFCTSLAAYSLACYVLQIKDRHNQNILIDGQGHIVHIDFGFLLSSFPGQGLKFEKAPFKMTQEFIDLLGGEKSKKFTKFRKLLQMGFMALQEHADKIIILVEMMMMGQGDLPCFEQGEETIRIMKENLFPEGRRFSQQECMQFTDWLINQSVNNWRTIWYDRVQYCCQGIV